MTRFIERQALRELLAASGDPLARELATLIEVSQSDELVAIEPVDPSTLLPTYRKRLEAADASLGPPTYGLADFVAALRDGSIAEMFSVTEGHLTGIGVLSPGGPLVVLTLVRAGR